MTLEVEFYDRLDRTAGGDVFYNIRIARVELQSDDEASMKAALHKAGFRPKKIIKHKRVEESSGSNYVAASN